MNTLTNAYVTKFSSGTILALLAISGLLVYVPATAPVFATNTSLPTITVSGANPVPGNTAGSVITFTISNPTSNANTVTGFSVTAATGWSISACPTPSAGSYLTVCSFSTSSATWTVSTYTVGTGAGIPPGGSQTVTFTAKSASGTYPFNSVFSTLVQDASAVNYYAGPSFTIQVMDPATVPPVITVTPGGTNTATAYTAGTAPYTITAVVTPHQAGLSIVWTDAGTGALSATYPSSFSSASSVTDSTGTATVTYQPSDVSGLTGIVTATIGTTALAATAATITTGPGAPTSAAITVTTATDGNDYSTTTASTATAPTVTGDAEYASAGVTFAITDAFGNGVDFSNGLLTAYTITLTALSGGGIFDVSYTGATAHPSAITCTRGGNWMYGATTLLTVVACPAAGTSAPIPFNYFQGGVYANIGKISVTVTGTYNAGSFSGTGTSANLVTSTFSGASPVPSVAPPPGATLATVPAGSSVTVSALLGTVQQGVPVTLYLDHATSYETTAGAKDYSESAVFSGGSQKISMASSATGTVSSTFAVDTVMGAHAFFLTAIAQPTNAAGPNNVLANSTDFATPAITVAGVPASFAISACFVATLTPTTCTAASGNLVGSHAAAGATVYVDVSISDAYGNPATNPGPNQIQINLVAPGSTLSVTNAYITTANPDTYVSLGWVAWTFPATVGTAVTLTASGVLSGVSKSTTDTITTVSPNPTISVTSPKPLNGYIYSGSTSVVFSGQANVSSGYATTVTIASVGYKVDSNPWQSAIVSSANKIVFSVAASMSVGLHAIVFNATDSKGNTVVSSSYQVLVDTSKPTIKSTTASSISAGSSVTFQVNDTEGDLSAATVKATSNSSATLSVTVTGTNNPGHLVTYTVSVSGLPTSTGHWGVTLNAKDLAGNAATAVTAVVKVTVAFAQSVVVQGTPTQTTIGGFNGVSATFTNEWSASQNVIVFAVWKNSAGQTVAVSTSGLTLAAGATGTAFMPLAGSLPAGSYTVNIFVWTTSNNSVSTTTSISGHF